MNQEKLHFDEYFEKIIIRSILSANDKFLHWIPHLKAEHFNSAHSSYFYGWIGEIKKKHSIIPTYKVLREQIKKDNLTEEERKSHLKALRELRLLKYKDSEATYILDKLGTFLRRQSYLIAMEKGIDLLQESKLDDLDKMFIEISRLGRENGFGKGLHYFPDLKLRLFRSRDHEKRYRFLIPELDKHLRHGGMKLGETVMWLAPTGVGKTMSLVHCAKAWLIQKLPGIYYTFQLPEDDIAERFDSSFSGIPINSLLENNSKVVQTVEKIGKRYGNALVIKYFPRYKHSIASVRTHLHQLREQGFNPRFIVLDFLNYIQPEGSSSSRTDSVGSRYYAGGDVAGEFVSFCQGEKILGAAGIQANRSASNQDLCSIEHVAESFASVMEATLVISVNRKGEERDQEKARLFLAKYSFGEDHIVIPINTNYQKGSLYRRL